MNQSKLAILLLSCLFSFSTHAQTPATQMPAPQICKCKEKLTEQKLQRHYKPFNHTINGISLIIYPVKDDNPLQAVFDPKDKKQMIAHIEALYAKHANSLKTGSYHILFMWNLDGKRMTDVWVHNMNNTAEANSGPLLDNYVFKDLVPHHDHGIASGDSIIVLGKEEELRRALGKEMSVKDFTDREKFMPAFPKNMIGSSFFS